VHSLYFRAETKDCFKCATFHGDYINLAYGSDGSSNVVWTDMRRFVTVGDIAGHIEHIFFSRRQPATGPPPTAGAHARGSTVRRRCQKLWEPAVATYRALLDLVLRGLT
jgi:hypothetical protein